MKRNFNLDLLRSIAFLMVFVFHFNLMMKTDMIETIPLFVSAESWTLGSLGVGIFLMISGYVLKNSYERSGEKIASFYKKRLLSIFPLFYACYFVVYLWIDVPSGHLISKNQIWSLLGIDGFMSVRGFNTSYRIGEWYLGVILIYYLLFPFLYKAVKKAPFLFGLSLLVLHVLFMYNYEALAAAVTKVFKHPLIPEGQAMSAIVWLLQFVIGIYFAFYVKKCHPALMALAAVIFGTLMVYDFPGRLFPQDSFKGCWIYGNTISVVALFMIIIYAFKKEKQQESKSARFPLFGFVIGGISKYSFSMFLVHHILQERLLLPLASQGGVSTSLSALKYFLYFFFCLALTFLLAYLIQNGTDTIMKNLKSRFAKKEAKAPSPVDQTSITT
ncbi:MAG: acyltransferase [Lachnospiraceae bacterium]|nr:acyltransferase [Lachnospiraceae bacterium]